MNKYADVTWKRNAGWMLALFLLVACTTARAQTAAATDLTLTGTITGSQSGGYVHVPFNVPAGMERVTITFDYTNRQQHSILDVGLRDPRRFRGWSGGNKREFTVGVADATPSYLPGVIVPGTWQLLIGVANVRPGQSTVFTAHVHLTPVGKAGFESFVGGPLRVGPAWYRGDLHMHTAHSDGTCPSQTGTMVPCPVFVTVEAAVARHLDFIAITDHNAESQYDAERELQPYFDTLLMIPGREITTYYGHANLFGTTEPIDFEVRQDDMDRLYREAHALGALLSLNHPAIPIGEACIGCGWNAKKFDMHLPDFIEAINGSNPLEHVADVAFWQKQLDAGIRVPAIGGSDTHRPMDTAGGTRGVGVPTIVVWAPELSVPAILNAMRAGHVFIDVAGTADRMLTLTAASQNTTAAMGDTMTAAAGAEVTLTAHVAHCAGMQLQWLVDGRPRPLIALAGTKHPVLRWQSDGGRHEIRAMVLSRSGEIEMLANPVYFNWTAKETR